MPNLLPLAAALLAALPLSAMAQQAPRGSAPAMTQQASGDYWIDPATGCSYARAHVPGWPPSWHLIRNGARIGLTNARPGCAVSLRSGG